MPLGSHQRSDYAYGNQRVSKDDLAIPRVGACCQKGGNQGYDPNDCPDRSFHSIAPFRHVRGTKGS
jgi:hypothetical protein